MVILMFDALTAQKQQYLLDYKHFKNDRNQTEEQKAIAAKAQYIKNIKMKRWYTDIVNKCFPASPLLEQLSSAAVAYATPVSSKQFIFYILNWENNFIF